MAKTRLIFFGPPGVGKGTYARKISKILGIPHISSGDLLREEIAKKTELGIVAAKYMDKGSYVPDDFVNDLMKERFAKDDVKKGVILDGYPRTLDQVDKIKKYWDIDLAVEIGLPDEILIKKLTARRTCEECGEAYSLVEIDEQGIKMPALLPKKEGLCGKCGGKLVQRKDDDESLVRERLKVYHDLTDPIIGHYKKSSEVRKVLVTGGPDEMVEKILKIIE